MALRELKLKQQFWKQTFVVRGQVNPLWSKINNFQTKDNIS